MKSSKSEEKQLMKKREVNANQTTSKCVEEGETSMNAPATSSYLIAHDVDVVNRTRHYRQSAASSLFPAMSQLAFEQLKLDIQTRGQHEPILARGDEIVDGWHRLRACHEIGIHPIIVEVESGRHDLSLSISKNLQRRQLGTSQRAVIAAKLCRRELMPPPLTESVATEPMTPKDAAALFCVSERSVFSAISIVSTGDNELIQAVLNGDLAVSTAAAVAKSETPALRASSLERALNLDNEAEQRSAITAELRKIGRKTASPPKHNEVGDVNIQALRQALAVVHDRFLQSCKTYTNALRGPRVINDEEIANRAAEVQRVVREIQRLLKPTAPSE